MFCGQFSERSEKNCKFSVASEQLLTVLKTNVKTKVKLAKKKRNVLVQIDNCRVLRYLTWCQLSNWYTAYSETVFQTLSNIVAYVIKVVFTYFVKTSTWRKSVMPCQIIISKSVTHYLFEEKLYITVKIHVKRFHMMVYSMSLQVILTHCLFNWVGLVGLGLRLDRTCQNKNNSPLGYSINAPSLPRNYEKTIYPSLDSFCEHRSCSG